MKNRIWMLGLAAALAACGSETPVAPTADAAMARGNPNGARMLTVMQQNLYVGANVDIVIDAIAGGGDVGAALATVINQLQHTDIQARAAAIADEVARLRPAVIAWEELSTIDIDLTNIGMPEVDFTIPFEPVLMGALAIRGLEYDIVHKTKNIDVDAGALLGVDPAPIIHLVDEDALLVRHDLTVDSHGGGNFTACIGGAAPCLIPELVPLMLKRGYAWAKVPIGGTTYTFVVTHLESSTPLASMVRLAQVGELMELINGTIAPTGPVVLMGDLNDVPGSDMHNVITDNGFSDAWAAMRPGAKGLTCCHADDLSDRVPPFDQRIDYIMTRGVGGVHDKLQGAIDVLASTPSARFPNYAGELIWPSDHAGLVGTFLSPMGGTK